MRRTLITLSTFAIIGMSAGAIADGPGCGLGQMLWKGQSGLLPHISAATTNGTSSNQWFGISFGTLDCNPDASVSNDYQRAVFAAANYDNLAQEAAQGEGNHLSALAEIMGIETADRTSFFTMAQNNHQTLFSASNNPQQMLSALDTTMLADPVLARYVKQ